jgi:riboflavin kinase/FMN adenylyltransferase
VHELGVRAVVVGFDFTYGARRKGTGDSLRAAGEHHGFEVHVLRAVELDGAPVSSTRVRAAIRSGDVDTAQRLLGRPFDVDGEVVHGAGRGGKIGVPTANVATRAELLPPPGVYAVRLHDGSAWHDAVANLGTRPTFDAGALALEVHIFDWSGDLYGRRVRVAFAHRLRDEHRFASIDALVTQIRADMHAAREVLARHG